MPEFVSPDLIDDLLLFVQDHPEASAEDIAASLWTKVSTIHEALQLCENQAVVRRRRTRLSLTASARSRLQAQAYHRRRICRKCSGRAVELPTRLFRSYRPLLKLRVSPNRTINQWQADENAVFARVNHLITDHGTRRRRVLFLGDDDFASIGIALYGDPSQVLVLDIDDRLIETIADIAATHRMPLAVSFHDLAHPLPADLHGAFDTTFGDPPYSLGGITQWLQRSIEALQGNGRGYLAVPYLDGLLQGPTTMAAITEFLHDNGFAVTDIIHGFHTYEGVDGLRSSMICYERIRPQYSLSRGQYWGEEPTADTLINRPVFDDLVVPYLKYLAGNVPENPLPGSRSRTR